MRLIILHINLQLFTINLFKYFNQDLVLYIYYRPQKKFAKVMFLQVSVILSTRGGGWRAWQGDVCGRGRACVAGGCVMGGGMRGRRGHAWHGGHVWLGGGHAWQILRDTVNMRAVRILLECFLVCNCS